MTCAPNKAQGLRPKRLPRYRLCWWCNNRLYGDKFAEVLAQGHVRVVHKTCMKPVEQAESAWSQP